MCSSQHCYFYTLCRLDLKGIFKSQILVAYPLLVAQLPNKWIRIIFPKIPDKYLKIRMQVIARLSQCYQSFLAVLSSFLALTAFFCFYESDKPFGITLISCYQHTFGIFITHYWAPFTGYFNVMAQLGTLRLADLTLPVKLHPNQVVMLLPHS